MNGRLVAAVVIPAAALLCWQYTFTYHSGNRAIEWAPFLVAGYYSGHLALKLLMSLLFPCFVSLLFYHPAKQDTFLVLSWLALIIGLAWFYLLA
jgi:hypothetical protein